MGMSDSAKRLVDRASMALEVKKKAAEKEISRWRAEKDRSRLEDKRRLREQRTKEARTKVSRQTLCPLGKWGSPPQLTSGSPTGTKAEGRPQSVSDLAQECESEGVFLCSGPHDKGTAERSIKAHPAEGQACVG
jgi:hypothetical protein